MHKYEGKTLEEAIINACSEKKVTKEELIYYIIEDKQGGLFGIGNKAIIEAFTSNDVSEFIVDYLTTYFNNIQMNVEINIEYSEDVYKVRLNADNNAVLIGKAGQTLQAICNVTKAAASAQFKRHINVLVDVNNYKEERYEKLKSTVEKIASTVAKTKVSARLGQMTNDERKVIHQFLSTFPHVKTESEGEGSERRLKIIYDSKE